MSLLTLGLAGCAPRVPPTTPVAPTLPTDPASLYALVRVQEDRIHTLRARFTARVEDRSEERTAEGVLLVKKPDRFRLRLMSVLGPTVLDYVSVGEHARLELPLQGKRLVDAEVSDDAAFSPAEMRLVFLRADAALPQRCLPAAAENTVVVTCRDAAGGILRTIRIDSTSGVVREETSFASDRPRVVMQFADHRRVEAFELPFTVQISYPERDVRVAITVRKYEVNPVLADDLFDANGTAGR